VDPDIRNVEDAQDALLRRSLSEKKLSLQGSFAENDLSKKDILWIL